MVSLNLKLKDLLGPVTRVKKKKKKGNTEDENPNVKRYNYITSMLHVYVIPASNDARIYTVDTPGENRNRWRLSTQRTSKVFRTRPSNR